MAMAQTDAQKAQAEAAKAQADAEQRIAELEVRLAKAQDQEEAQAAKVADLEARIASAALTTGVPMPGRSTITVDHTGNPVKDD